jgi:two-component system, cell cycle sensor histidine kinase and response regulator CckA
MPERPNLIPTAAERRKLAEERLREQHHEAHIAQEEAQAQRLVHELQVHQIELQMQNAELQQARDELEAALEKYSDLYDFAPVGYLTLDHEGIIREANLTTADLLGIERSGLLNRRFGLLLSAASLPVFAAFLSKLLEGRAREFCEVTISREGKPPIEVQIEATVVASGLEFRAALTDITERKRIEKDRLIISKLESTGIMAGGIAHDFNNLLMILLLNLELAQTLVKPDEELAFLLEQAKRVALDSQRLTKRLVAFAQGGAPVRELTSLTEVIRESAHLAVRGSRTQCDFSLTEDLWAAEVDAGQIGQVVLNLVGNAQEAMPHGGVVSIRAENAVLESHNSLSLSPGDYVRISIADQGLGMSKEVLAKIFDPYFSTKQRGDQRGMGLGLTICHTIIKHHRGAIAVESEPDVRTTFHIYIPASRKVHPKEKAAAPANLPQHGRILVMDDEEELRKLVGISLQHIGYEVELAADGLQAIEVYRNAKEQGHPFNAVILDLTVRAGVGGQEAIQTLLQFDPAVKAIVMSGYANDPVLTEPERYGFKGILAKPFSVNKLREVLSMAMGK